MWQIRQQVLASYANSMIRDTAMSALRDSVYCNDLEYYASLYRVKLKDLLPGPPQAELGNSGMFLLMFCAYYIP